MDKGVGWVNSWRDNCIFWIDLTQSHVYLQMNILDAMLQNTIFKKKRILTLCLNFTDIYQMIKIKAANLARYRQTTQCIFT